MAETQTERNLDRRLTCVDEVFGKDNLPLSQPLGETATRMPT